MIFTFFRTLTFCAHSPNKQKSVGRALGLWDVRDIQAKGGFMRNEGNSQETKHISIKYTYAHCLTTLFEIDWLRFLPCRPVSKIFLCFSDFSNGDPHDLWSKSLIFWFTHDIFDFFLCFALLLKVRKSNNQMKL